MKAFFFGLVFVLSFARAEANPHTVCWEKENPNSGLEIYLSDYSDPSTKVEVYQHHLATDKRLLAVRTANLIRLPQIELYRGDGIDLEISSDADLTTGERQAELTLELAKSPAIKKKLLCDSLQYSTGEAQSNF